MRLVPGVLPGIPFGKATPRASLGWIEGFAVIAVFQAGFDKTVGLVEVVTPGFGALLKFRGYRAVAHGFRHARDGPVVKGILDCLGGGFVIVIDRHVSVL